MLRIADKVFDSHLFTGTGKFASPQLMVDAIRESGSQLVTLAMKRVDLRQHNDAILAPLLEAGVTLLPNTSGAKTAEEAIFAAQLAREACVTSGDSASGPLVAGVALRVDIKDFDELGRRDDPATDFS